MTRKPCNHAGVSALRPCGAWVLRHIIKTDLAKYFYRSDSYVIIRRRSNSFGSAHSGW